MSDRRTPHLAIVDGDERRSKHTESILRILEQALERAKRGEISALVLFEDIAGSDEWLLCKSSSPSYLELIGKLEDAKMSIWRDAKSGK